MTIWEAVVNDMKGRDEYGERKYGRRLEAFDGRKTLQDAYEEALDLAVYLKKEIIERTMLETKRVHFSPTPDLAEPISYPCAVEAQIEHEARAQGG